MGEARKVIAESRDRMQSRLLVWVVAPLLASYFTIPIRMAMQSSRIGIDALKVFGVSLTFGLLVWALRAATPMAAICGSMICFVVTFGTWYPSFSLLHSGLAPLMLLFLLTFAATRSGRQRKTLLGLAESRKGRNAGQVVANLGMSGIVVVFLGYLALYGGVHLLPQVVPALLIAALCEATADTISSEVGQAFGGRPFLLTTFRRVDPGTDGALSLLGTAAGLVAAVLIAAVGMWSMSRPWQTVAAGLAGGITGWLFDSLLGATVERCGWLGNDLVNFLSTAVAVMVAFAVWVLF